MNKVIFTLIEEDKDLPNETGIEWLDTVLKIAEIITARMLIQIEQRARYKTKVNPIGDGNSLEKSRA